MNKLKNIKTQGIVLKGINYGDYDQILTVLTRDLGKIKVFARGVRRGKSKLRGGSQVFSYVDLELFQGKNFYRMIQTANLKSFIEIREDYDKLLAASEWSEVLDRMIIEEEKDQELFSLALAGFTYLAYKETEKTLRSFEAKLLHHQGLLAQETTCSSCHAQEEIFFTESGDCFCPGCAKIKGNNYLDKGSLKILCFFIKESPENIDRLKISVDNLSRISNFIKNQISASLGKELKVFQI